MSLPKEKAWFPAKRYGYGWSVPTRWQGWLVLIGYLGALGVGIALFAGKHAGWLATYTLAVSAILIAVCAWKGEAPRWRWGDKDEA